MNTNYVNGNFRSFGNAKREYYPILLSNIHSRFVYCVGSVWGNLFKYKLKTVSYVRVDIV